MSLSVCVSASSTEEKLARTSDLRAFMGSTSTARDVAHALAIKAASRWVENKIGQPLLAAVYLEKVAGFGGRTLMLSRTPILNVFRFFDSTSTDTATQILSSEFRVDAERGMLSRDAGFAWDAALQQDLVANIIPSEPKKPWMVEYSAGYFFPGSSSTEYGTTSTGQITLPDNIHTAVLMKAARLFERTGNIQSEAVGDFRTSYKDSDDSDILDLLPVRIV